MAAGERVGAAPVRVGWAQRDAAPAGTGAPITRIGAPDGSVAVEVQVQVDTDTLEARGHCDRVVVDAGERPGQVGADEGFGG
ncbi:hypothetical protein ABZ783_25015 [Micromonospora sp. NPDC047738]